MIWDAIRKLFGRGASGEAPGGTAGSPRAPSEAGPTNPSPAGGEAPCPESGTGAPMVPCEEALARIYEFMDGELDPAAREQVAAHFEACARCYPNLRFEERFRARVQAAVGRPEVPQHLRNRVLGILDDGA